MLAFPETRPWVEELLKTHPGLQKVPRATGIVQHLPSPPSTHPARSTHPLQLPLGEGPPTAFDSDLDPLTSSDDEARRLGPWKRPRLDAAASVTSATQPPASFLPSPPPPLHPSLPHLSSASLAPNLPPLSSFTTTQRKKRRRDPAKEKARKKPRDEKRASARIERKNEEALHVKSSIDFASVERSQVYSGKRAVKKTGALSMGAPVSITQMVPAGEL